MVYLYKYGLNIHILQFYQEQAKLPKQHRDRDNIAATLKYNDCNYEANIREGCSDNLPRTPSWSSFLHQLASFDTNASSVPSLIAAEPNMCTWLFNSATDN